MKIEVRAIRFRGAIHGLAELPGGDRLVVHSDRSLFALSWLPLQHTPGGVTVAPGPQNQAQLLATNVAVDNAWVVQPKAQHVLLAREGALDSIDLSGKQAGQRIPVTGLPKGAFAAALAPDEQHVLLAVLRLVNPDFANYGVVMVDVTNGRLIRERTIGAGNDLELLWDAKLRTWVIGDTTKGDLWRWDGSSPAVKLAAPPAVRVHAATFTAAAEGVVVSAVFEAGGVTGLISGPAERDKVAWTTPVKLPGTPVLQARCHPEKPLWVCLAQEGAAQQIQIRDAAGKIQAEAAVQPAAHLDRFTWSPSNPDRLWAHGARAIAAAQLSE